MLTRLAVSLDPTAGNAVAMALFQAGGGDDVFGQDPLEGYDIGVDEAGLYNVNAKIMGFFLNLVFALIKFVARVVASFVEWAATFEVPSLFGTQAEVIAQRFHNAIGFDNPGANTLFRLALVLMVLVIFSRFVRGRQSKGIAEAGVSWMILMVYFGWIVASPTGYATVVSGTVGASQDFGGAVAAGILGAAPELLPPECELGGDDIVEVGCAIRSGVYATYVEIPYDILNWGHPLGAASDGTNPHQACAAARDSLVAEGPWGNSDEPRSRMSLAGCTEEAEYQGQPTGDRLGDAFGILLLEFFSLIAPAILALVTIYAGVRLMLRGMAVPVVVAMGIIPGQPRVGLWRWVGKTLNVMVSLGNAIVSLAIYLVLVSSAFSLGTTNLLLAMLIHIIVGIVVVIAWWRIGQAGKQHVEQLSNKLANSEGGSTEGAPIRQQRAGLSTAEYRLNSLSQRARTLKRMSRR